ncbi:MAG: hypothetical protein JNL90_01015 [Planctomycetes bacterium]|nr:hypothetical protein [Planctomycetota bacterium]
MSRPLPLAACSPSRPRRRARLASAAAFALLLLAAAEGVAQSAPLAPPSPVAQASPSQRAPFEVLLYKFDAERDLVEFEPLAGSWSISAGSLWCTSKGPREELRWRRALTPRGKVTARLLGGGKVALLLRAGEQETQIVVDRAASRVAVECDGAPLAARAYEATAGAALALAVAWELDRLSVRIGDDEPFTLTRPGALPLDGLALLSFQSQPRFDELAIEREPTREALPSAAGVRALSESERLAIEQATQLLEGDDAPAAFERLRAALGERVAKAAEWPAPLLALLQKVALRRPALRSREPLAALVAAATLAAADGSATLVLPLRPAWSGEALPIRRTDGPVFLLRCADPQLAVEVYRYDQKLKYWFGRDPRLVYSSGGGGSTLGRARADEQHDFHARCQLVREFERSGRSIDGESAWEYEIAWPDADDGARTLGLRELFVLHRGDTWRITVAGAPLAQQLAADEIEWLLAQFEFAR